ncbi:hypothetical protein F511_33570 [Dorcoceras hygrometricum]|uniref:Uncharacterized protein n=1 Tax=Dorcoceras hygrometricum TaxID=472368 RepID=A0A2Z7C0U6_9LAMI|nr:hypothetical protein F511_33570 [Dorcoceras hygrometricum]
MQTNTAKELQYLMVLEHKTEHRRQIWLLSSSTATDLSLCLFSCRPTCYHIVHHISQQLFAQLLVFSSLYQQLINDFTTKPMSTAGLHVSIADHAGFHISIADHAGFHVSIADHLSKSDDSPT